MKDRKQLLCVGYGLSIFERTTRGGGGSNCYFKQSVHLKTPTDVLVSPWLKCTHPKKIKPKPVTVSINHVTYKWNDIRILLTAVSWRTSSVQWRKCTYTPSPLAIGIIVLYWHKAWFVYYIITWTLFSFLCHCQQCLETYYQCKSPWILCLHKLTWNNERLFLEAGYSILLQGFLVEFEFSGGARCPNKGMMQPFYLATILVYSISNVDFVYSRKLVFISQTYPLHKLSCLLLLYVQLILFLHYWCEILICFKK